MRLELSFEMRLERRTQRENSSRRIISSCARLYTKDAQPDELKMFAQVLSDG